MKPSQVQKLKEVFVEEKLISTESRQIMDLYGLRARCIARVLSCNATYAKSMRKIYNDPDDIMLQTCKTHMTK